MSNLETQTPEPNFGTVRDDLEQHPRFVRGVIETTAATTAFIGTSVFGPAVGLLPYGAYRTWRAYISNKNAQDAFEDPRDAGNVHPTPTGYVVDTGNDSYPIEDIDRQRKVLTLRRVVPQVMGGLSVAALSVIGPTGIYNTVSDNGGELAEAEEADSSPAEAQQDNFNCPLVMPLYPVTYEEAQAQDLETKLSTAALQTLFAGMSFGESRSYNPNDIDGWYGTRTSVSEAEFENFISQTEQGLSITATNPYAITNNGFFDTKTECLFASSILANEAGLDLSNLSNNPELTQHFLK